MLRFAHWAFYVPMHVSAGQSAAAWPRQGRPPARALKLSELLQHGLQLGGRLALGHARGPRALVVQGCLRARALPHHRLSRQVPRACIPCLSPRLYTLCPGFAACIMNSEPHESPMLPPLAPATLALPVVLAGREGSSTYAAQSVPCVSEGAHDAMGIVLTTQRERGSRQKFRERYREPVSERDTDLRPFSIIDR